MIEIRSREEAERELGKYGVEMSNKQLTHPSERFFWTRLLLGVTEYVRRVPLEPIAVDESKTQPKKVYAMPPETVSGGFPLEGGASDE